MGQKRLALFQEIQNKKREDDMIDRPGHTTNVFAEFTNTDYIWERVNAVPIDTGDKRLLPNQQSYTFELNFSP